MEEKLKGISRLLAKIYNIHGLAQEHEVIKPILDTLTNMNTVLQNHEARIKTLEDQLNSIDSRDEDDRIFQSEYGHYTDDDWAEEQRQSDLILKRLDEHIANFDDSDSGSWAN